MYRSFWRVGLDNACWYLRLLTVTCSLFPISETKQSIVVCTSFKSSTGTTYQCIISVWRTMAIFLHDNTHTQNLHPYTTADFWDKLHTKQICRGETRLRKKISQRTDRRPLQSDRRSIKQFMTPTSNRHVMRVNIKLSTIRLTVKLFEFLNMALITAE